MSEGGMGFCIWPEWWPRNPYLLFIPRHFPNPMRRQIFLASGLLLVGASVFALFNASRGVPEAGEEPGAMEPTDWFYLQRAFPQGEINYAAVHEAHQQASAMRMAAEARGGASWTFAGPTNIGGRVTSIAAESFTTFYVGTGSGGVFKSTDGGASFTPLGDDVLSLSIGDIVLDPSDDQTVYIGTGEANGGGGSLTYGGQGLFRSTNAGASWTSLGLEDTGTIGRVIVHPTSPGTIWVAAAGKLFANDEHRGVYRTTNGGTTWTKPLFVNDSTGVIDLAVNPRSPDTLYAASWERRRRANDRHYGGPGSGVHRSIDGGATWTRLTGGLPTDGDVGRIGLAVASSRPNVVYAIYTDTIGNTRTVYRSINGGDSWTSVGAPSGVSYGWWFGQLRVDPTDEDVLFAPWLNLYRSTNGGASWSFASSGMHVDHHALWIDPENPSQLIAGNDGGLYRSTNAGSSWTKASGGFPVTQYYTVEIDDAVPSRLYGGTQDNGTNRTLTGADNDWHSIYGGDGFYVLVDPTDNNFVYAESQYGNLGRSTNGGSSFSGATSGISGRTNWNTPVEFDPQDPTVLYYGSDKVFRSTNRAVNWSAISPDLTDGPGNGNLVFGTITTIGVAPSDPNTIWVGTDDGHVAVTENLGSSWSDVSAGLSGRWVTRVMPHPDEPRTAFATVSGYRWDEPGANVYYTNDGGQTWTPRSSGLPEAPVNDILFDPLDSDRLYLASDVGVFYSDDAGTNWNVVGIDLPAAPVLDIDLHPATRTLVAATYGRSMYRFDLSVLPTAGEEIVGLQTGSSLSIYPNPVRSTATIRYALARPSDIVLEVFDSRGRRVDVLERGMRLMGVHTVPWRLSSRLAAGTYLVRLLADQKETTVSVTVLR